MDSFLKYAQLIGHSLLWSRICLHLDNFRKHYKTTHLNKHKLKQICTSLRISQNANVAFILHSGHWIWSILNKMWLPNWLSDRQSHLKGYSNKPIFYTWISILFISMMPKTFAQKSRFLTSFSYIFSDFSNIIKIRSTELSELGIQ